jgi:hypothetical protein
MVRIWKLSQFRRSRDAAQHFHVVSALYQYRVLLDMLLKITHPLTFDFNRFYTAWLEDEAA